MIHKLINACGGRGPSDPSLRRLRNRLLLINIVSLTIVVVVSMSIVYLTMFGTVQREIDERLRQIPPGVAENVRLWHGIRDATISVMPSSTSFPLGGGIFIDGSIIVEDSVRLPVDYDKSFVANVMPDGQITVFSLIDISDRELYIAIQAALTANEMRNSRFFMVETSGVEKPGIEAFGIEKSGPVFINGESWNYKVVTTTNSSPDIAEYQTSIVFLNTEEEIGRLRALGFSLMIICAGSMLVILFIGYFFANRAMAPVQASMDRQRRFVADASHELKTPITVISMNAEAARGSTNGEEITNNLVNIETETTRMDGLVRDLISLAREEEIRPVVSQFDLTDALEEETGRVETILFEKDIDFKFENPAVPAIVYTDREKLKKVISILLDNAVKYTPSGGYVKAILVPGTGKTRAQVVIENSGAYISPEDLSRIFDRFYRSDKSRNSDTGGHGMGLAIAKEITRGLGKQLKAESTPRADGGAVNRFYIIL